MYILIEANKIKLVLFTIMYYHLRSMRNRYKAIYKFSIVVIFTIHQFPVFAAGVIDPEPNTDSLPAFDQPAKTVVDFLDWYRHSAYYHSNAFVNNVGQEYSDSAKFYSVNFTETEKYLDTLKATGWISEKYIAQWRQYFADCQKEFDKNPQNDGPAYGFDADLIMLSQEYDEDLDHLEKCRVAGLIVTGAKATVVIEFYTGRRMKYLLSMNNGIWQIDDIDIGYN